MKKNLSQSLKQGPSRIQLLVQDGLSKKYFLKPDDDASEPDPFMWYWLPSFDFYEAKDQLALRLIQELRPIGFTVDLYRELERENVVAYSFADKAPGSFCDVVCLYVVGNTINEVWQHDDKPGELVSLAGLAGKVNESPGHSPIAQRAIQKLMQEEHQDG